MRRQWMRAQSMRAAMLTGLIVLLAGCGGGSGSTGLITSENVVIDDVRETGTCGEFDGAPYCATDSPDATAPGGQTAAVVPAPQGTSTPRPSPSATPQAGGPTPTNGNAPSSTPGGQPTPASSSTPGGQPTPAPSASPADQRTVTVALEGFDEGAACAVAARPAASDDAWRTGPLTPVDPAGGAVTFTFPPDVAPPLDAALLCFDEAASVAPELATLADAEPTVVFVLPE